MEGGVGGSEAKDQEKIPFPQCGEGLCLGAVDQNTCCPEGKRVPRKCKKGTFQCGIC